MDDKEAGVMLTFLRSERAIDRLRWVAAFVAVVLAYGVAGWMLLRPTGWQIGVNAPVVEVDLWDSPQPSAIAPGDHASKPATRGNPHSANAQMKLPGSADTAPRAAGGSASRADAGDAAKDADAVDAKDGSPDAAKTAALDKAENPEITQPRPPDDATPEASPKTEAPAAGNGGGGRPTAAPPRVATPDTSTSTAANIVRTPIDTSITVNQGRSLLRSATGGPQFRGVPPPQLKLAPPLATPKDRNELFSKKQNPIAGATLPAPGPMTTAANHGHAQDLTQKPAMAADGGVARNAIGVVIEQRAVAPPPGAPLGVHSLPGGTSTAMHASGERSPARTAAGASLAANNARPSSAGRSSGVGNRSQTGHPDQALHANHVASIGGSAINGASMSRPASSTGALNGSSFRPKYP